MTGDLTINPSGSPADIFLLDNNQRLWIMSRDSDQKAFLISSNATNTFKRGLEVQASQMEVKAPLTLSDTALYPVRMKAVQTSGVDAIHFTNTAENAWRNIKVADPTQAEHAATKKYVDGHGRYFYTSTSIPSSTTGDNILSYSSDIASWGTAVTRSGNTLVADVTGMYEITLNGGFSSAGGGSIRMLGIRINGFSPATQGIIGAYAHATANTSGWGAALSAHGYYKLTAGDYITPYARQDSGAALTLNANFGMRLVAAT